MTLSLASKLTKSVRVALAMALASAATVAAWRFVSADTNRPAGQAAHRPFTRESALEDARREFPNAALPLDLLPESVQALEGVVYDPTRSPALELDVYWPRAPGRYAMVLVVHGGGWERGSRQMERPFAKRLASAGFVVVPVSYRLGSAGRFPHPLFDLKTAVRFLRANAARFSGDAARVAAIGASSGGQLVALLGATNGRATLEGDGPFRSESSRVDAVIDLDGLADFTGAALVAKEAANPGAPTRFLGGTYRERAPAWREASALSHVDEASAPTLFLNSTASTPILPGRSEMKERLARAGVPAELVVFGHTPHTFWLLEPWYSQVLAECQRFLEQRLPNVGTR